MKDINVTLVAGFLEAGKTTYINNLLKDTTNKILLICCEEGNTEYSYTNPNITLVNIEYSEDFNRIELKDLQEKYDPDEVIIEVNGTWQMQYVQPALPFNFKLKEMVTIVDAATFVPYLRNMTSLMNEKIRLADKVYFNNVTEENAQLLRKKNLRLVNPKDTIYLNFADHQEKYDNGNLRPESFTKAEIIIEDSDFGYWFADFSSEPAYYLNKKITLRGLLVKLKELAENQFVVGRNAMVCCANDMTFLAMMCNGTTDLENNSWIEVTGIIKNNPINPKTSPYCIEVLAVSSKEAPKDPIVY